MDIIQSYSQSEAVSKRKMQDGNAEGDICANKQPIHQQVISLIKEIEINVADYKRRIEVCDDICTLFKDAG